MDVLKKGLCCFIQPDPFLCGFLAHIHRKPAGVGRRKAGHDGTGQRTHGIRGHNIQNVGFALLRLVGVNVCVAES